MRKALFALLAAACVLVGFGTNAIASDRQVIYPGENIGSSDWNLQARHVRIEMGTWLLHALNLEGSVSGSGTYANLTVSPGTGLYVTVAPSAANTRGAIYQVVPVDALPLPSAAPAVVSPSPSPLPTDSSLIVVPALQSSTSSQIGPLTAPGAGLAVIWLIEAQVSTSDTNVDTRTFITSIGTRQPLSVATTRSDQIVYQALSGVPAASPVPPTPNPGWIGVGSVYVANGQSSITTGNITASQGFAGFAQSAPVIPCPSPGSNVTITGVDLPNCTINASISSGASFSGGVGIDSNTAPTNGVSCGIANTTPCQFKAATGTTTTTGYTFDTTTACHAVGDSFVQFRVLGANQGALNCSGALALAGGIGLGGNAAPANGVSCGVANSVACQFVATTGTATTTGFLFNTTTGCHVTTDNAYSFQVNSVAEAAFGCSGGLNLLAGIGLGGNAAPANGIACGVANTTSCNITATTGTTTTTGLVFNTTSACHAATDSFVKFQVNATSELTGTCQGDVFASGAIVAGGQSIAHSYGAGDVTAARTGTTGAYWFGSGASAGLLNYGVSSPGFYCFTNAGGTGAEACISNAGVLSTVGAQSCGTPAGYHVECGNATVSSCAGGAQCNLTAITFATAFTATPFCTITARLASGNAPVDAMINTVSATGVTFTIYNGTGATITSPSEPYICIGV